jgi:hypothetical protein
VLVLVLDFPLVSRSANEEKDEDDSQTENVRKFPLDRIKLTARERAWASLSHSASLLAARRCRDRLRDRQLLIGPVATRVFPFFEIPNCAIRLVVLL